MLSDYLSKGVLNYAVGKGALPALAQAYVGLFTAPPTDAGGGTEVVGGSYARVGTGAAGASFSAASGSAPSSITNSATLNFATATADWGTIVAAGLFDASVAGNLLAWDWLGNFPYLPYFCTLASPGVFDVAAHGFVNGDKVILNSEFGGTIPTGLTANNQYTVAGVATDSFNVGVNTTASGNGMVRKVTPQSIPSGVQPSFAPGTILIYL